MKINLPCYINDKVYIIGTCDITIPKLDGELYDIVDGLGGATGYYCPYETDCPFDEEIEWFFGCEDAEKKITIFEDSVSEIMISDTETCFVFENCKYECLKDFNKTWFTSKKKALDQLKIRKNFEVK